MTDALPPLHASAFAYQGAGCLLLGASGTGKSRLTSEALMFGAKFVADDQVQLGVMSGMLTASPVPSLAGVLELRGYGLLRMTDFNQKQVLHLAIELVEGSNERLPTATTREFLGFKLPHITLPPVPQTTVAGLLLYLRAMQEGRILPQDWAAKRT